MNDYLTTIPGTRTLWHDLCEWTGGEWHGGDYDSLADIVEWDLDVGNADLIIRNASWFRPIDADIKTISLVQDIMPAGLMRQMQMGVCRDSTLTVFNSAYTKAQYPELDGVPSRVIPLSVDFDLFHPMEVPPVADVCWVGAISYIKGWDILMDVIKAMPQTTFALVLKENLAAQMPENVRVFIRVPHSELPAIINGCRVGLCTSRVETQHLAGIEMGVCGLPMVAPNVGAYYGGCEPKGWGTRTDHMGSITEAVSAEITMNRSAESVRRYWMESGYTRDACRSAWLEAVEWALNSAS